LFGGRGTTSWKPVKIFSDGTFTDLWGIRYKVIDGIYSNIVENPLRPAKTVKDIKDYFSKLPDPKAVAEAATKNLEEEAEYLFKNTTYGIKGEPMWSHFELCQWIRGMDEFFIDMIQNEEMAYSLFNSLFEYECKMFEIYFKKVGKFLDIVWVSDDFGAQYGLLVKKDMMVNQVKPWQKKRIDFIRERAPQAKIFLHSCGSVYDFIPDLIEIGLDGLNPLQPFATNMEPEKLKGEFGDKLVFMGGLDHQFILSRPVDEVKTFVERLVKAYAPGGGYIFSTTHVMPSSAKVESIVAAFEYIQEIGRYLA